MSEFVLNVFIRKLHSISNAKLVKEVNIRAVINNIVTIVLLTQLLSGSLFLREEYIYTLTI